MTDANVALGRIAGSARLGGSVRLDGRRATDALSAVGDQVGLDADATGLGMVEIVEAHMERAIRAVSIEQGADPRRAALVAFGGAGGLHATALARRLDMAGVIVPAHAGVFSALGLLLAPPRADVARSMLLAGHDPGLDDAIDAIGRRARQALTEAATRVETIVDVRYRGQSHETRVPYAAGDGWDTLASRFHEVHRVRNGFARPDDPIEVVTLRAEAVGEAAVRWEDLPGVRPSGEPRLADREVLTSAGPVTATGWWRPALRPGSEVRGPAVIEEPDATTYLAAGERAIVHESGALEVTW